MSSDHIPILARGQESGPTNLTTRTGFRFAVRPAEPDDANDLAALVSNVSDDDRRFRFLTAMTTLPSNTLTRMTNVDHQRTEDFLAFDGDTMIASAMVAADAGLTRAEIAICIHNDYKKRGIGWALLEHAVGWARSKGIKTVESIESWDNHDAIELQREMGFTAHPYPGDATLVLISKDLG